jgi:signal transduction histidine kinase
LKLLGLAGSASARARAAFLVAMLVLTAGLAWLGWYLLDQDRQLAMQRLVEQREDAADLGVSTLERRWLAVERDLDRVSSGGDPSTINASSDGAVFVRFEVEGLRAWPARGLPYYPQVPAAPDVSNAVLDAADALEFGRQDYSAAVDALTALSRAADRDLSAAAFVRIARNHVKRRDGTAALKAYKLLEELSDARVAHLPAPLAARLGRLAFFAQQGDREAALEEARALETDLLAGRWPLTFATYQFLRNSAGEHLLAEQRATDSRLVLAEALLLLWESVHVSTQPPPPPRTSTATALGPAVIAWRQSGEVLSAFVAGREFVERQWLSELTPLFDSRGVRLSLTTPAGQHMFGVPAANQRPAIRLASATDLPWTIQVTNTDAASDALRGRRRLLAAVMAGIVALILAGAWFVGRAVTRELAVAELQSDFVSAVSHEFRTPLTTLCQLSELLMRKRVASESDRQQYYELLNGESHRLRQLVERLLDFGRLEAGRMPFRFEPLDAGAFLRDIVGEFEGSRHALGHTVELHVHVNGTTPMIRADRDTLRSAVWNLLENATKYSPACPTVWVDLDRRDAHVEVSVRDGGVGIPRAEHRRIFQKFVRGAHARTSDVRGTGVGLAMVRQIAEAHGGTIRVESAPDQGSTFRLVLPEMIA